MRTLRACLILFVSARSFFAVDDCTSSALGLPKTSADYAVVDATNVSTSTVSAAGDMWNNQNVGGFPYFVTTVPPQGFSYAVLHVIYTDGISPSPGRCGGYQGQTVNVYHYTQNPSNLSSVQNCTAQGIDQLIAHEFGHFLGLANVTGSACPTCIMQQVNGQVHTVHDCEANKASLQNKQQWETAPQGHPPPQPPVNNGSSPIIINLDGDSFRSEVDGLLSSPDDPVTFDITADAAPELIAWTLRESNVGFLALDRNGNGSIDNGAELFGNHTSMADGAPAQSSGYAALGSYDEVQAGGNHDGRIGPADAIWPRLRIWVDRDHDGISQPSELLTMWQAKILEFGTGFVTRREQDEFGNFFRYESFAVMIDGQGRRRIVPTWDVFFRLGF